MATNSRVFGVDVTKTFLPVSASTPEIPALPFTIGTIAFGENEQSEFVFCLAGGTLTAGDVVQITPVTYSAAGITTTLGKYGSWVGVAATSIASASYGWIQRMGYTAAVNIKASCLPYAQLATTATAGRLDDAVTTGYKFLKGIVILTTQAATVGTKAGILNWPIVDTTRPATI